MAPGQLAGSARQWIANDIEQALGNAGLLSSQESSSFDSEAGRNVEIKVVIPASGFAQAKSSEAPADTAMAKIAVGSRPTLVNEGKQNSASEKTFLNVDKQAQKQSDQDAGIGVARPSADMPASFTAHRYERDQQVFPADDSMRDVALTAMRSHADSTVQIPQDGARHSSDAALAHRAVQTVLNVVEAQQDRPSNSGVVNLHFKFGGENLAVRVQLRGSEVFTQFRTDSAELRAALAAQWRSGALPVGETGVRMAEPVFASLESAGFGASPQGQFSSQHQQAQHQQQVAQFTSFPELRALRRGTGLWQAKPVADAPPHSIVAPPTSQHLTAFA